MTVHDHHKNVQNLHNAMAKSEDPGLATVRPNGTTSKDLKRISKSISRNIKLEYGDTLLDVGCGNGMLSSLLLNKTSKYVGIDYSRECLRVFANRHSTMNVDTDFALFEADVILDLSRFGQFDRVLAYASFHYMESESEASGSLRNMLAQVKPGGVLMLGNLPLSDLPTFTSGESFNYRGFHKTKNLAKWLFSNDQSIINLKWKLVAMNHLVFRKIKRVVLPSQNLECLPPLEVIALELTTLKLRQWLSESGYEINFQFLPTCARAPLAIGRADLIVNVKQ